MNSYDYDNCVDKLANENCDHCNVQFSVFCLQMPRLDHLYDDCLQEKVDNDDKR